jgi:hypothetical protein
MPGIVARRYTDWAVPTRWGGESFDCTDRDVRVFRPDRFQENAQWIWSSPLTELRTVGCMGYNRGFDTMGHPHTTMQLQPLPLYL